MTELSGLRGWRLALTTFLIVVIVSAVGFLFDRVLFREGIPRTEVIATSDCLTGMVAGVLFLEFVRNERRHRQLMRKRLEVIAEMNHHIRNALQIFTYLAGNNSASRETSMMRDSIERIEWALREVLPGYVPESYSPPDKLPENQAHP